MWSTCSCFFVLQNLSFILWLPLLRPQYFIYIAFIDESPRPPYWLIWNMFIVSKSLNTLSSSSLWGKFLFRKLVHPLLPYLLFGSWGFRLEILWIGDNEGFQAFHEPPPIYPILVGGSHMLFHLLYGCGEALHLFWIRTFEYVSLQFGAAPYSVLWVCNGCCVVLSHIWHWWRVKISLSYQSWTSQIYLWIVFKILIWWPVPKSMRRKIRHKN